MNMGDEFWHQEIIDVDLSIITEQKVDFETFFRQADREKWQHDDERQTNDQPIPW